MTRDTFEFMDDNRRQRERFGENETVRSTADARSDLVDLALMLHHETPARGVNPGAILVSNDGDDHHAQWIPKSRCEVEKHGAYVDGTRKDGSRVKYQSCTVRLPESLAREKGLV